MEQQISGQALCAACGALGRLHCADCDRTFCVEHVERHFAMGYFYLCAACTARRAQESRPGRSRKRPSRT
jgi:NAD-dependent SIR2 family protein deacetylase